MVYRIYTETRKEHSRASEKLMSELYALGIRNITNIRIVTRFFIEGIDYQTFVPARYSVFSQQTNDITDVMPCHDADRILYRELLPGQRDRLAESVSLSLAIINGGPIPKVRTAEIYAFYGNVSKLEYAQIRRYLINSNMHRESDDTLPDTLSVSYGTDTNTADDSTALFGFFDIAEEHLSDFAKFWRLSMTDSDLHECLEYFASTEKREPTPSELRVIDSFRTEEVRHSSFAASLDNISIEDSCIRDAFEDYLEKREMIYSTVQRPVSIADISTMAARYLKRIDRIDYVDAENDTDNCSVRFTFDINGKKEDWILMFSYGENSNATEAEPYIGSENCIGRTALELSSGRCCVYQAVRISGCSDPDQPEPLNTRGKLTQSKIISESLDGSSSYSCNAGIPISSVCEIYHPDYIAKHFESTAALGAALASDITRSMPKSGDTVVLVGSATGRDGCKYITGGEKGLFSEDNYPGTDIAIGNPDIQKRMIRFFSDPKVSKIICSAAPIAKGGAAVALAKLSDSITVNLDGFHLKYPNLTAEEIITSETPERIAVCLRRADLDIFIKYAESEDLTASLIGMITADKRFKMSKNGKLAVNLSYDFLLSGWTHKREEAIIGRVKKNDLFSFPKNIGSMDIRSAYFALMSDIGAVKNTAAQSSYNFFAKGNAALSPSGGANMLSQPQYSASVIPIKDNDKICSLIAYGADPYLTKRSSFHGAVYATIDSLSKLVASGADISRAFLAFEEFFEDPHLRPKSRGDLLSAMLGAYKAQIELGIPSLANRESLFGSKDNLDVPPTFVSFAICTADTETLITPEFKSAGSRVYLLSPLYDESETMLPIFRDQLNLFGYVRHLAVSGMAKAIYAIGYGGIANAIFRMCSGNGIGFSFDSSIRRDDLFDYKYGAFIVETDYDISGEYLGLTVEDPFILCNNAKISLQDLLSVSASVSGSLPSGSSNQQPIAYDSSEKTYTIRSDYRSAVKCARPRIAVPVFPYTVGESEIIKKFEECGGEVERIPILFSSEKQIIQSLEYLKNAIDNAQILALPDGTEPIGSCGIATSVLRSEIIKEATDKLLNKNDGLILGIGDGFAALLRSGLLPYGRITDTLPLDAPAISQNITEKTYTGFIQLKAVSCSSPWLMGVESGDILALPASHKCGRFSAHQSMLSKLSLGNQIAFQYISHDGNAPDGITSNPFMSSYAIESIISSDGKIFGRLTHPEFDADKLWKNVPGNKNDRSFESAVKYYS